MISISWWQLLIHVILCHSLYQLQTSTIINHVITELQVLHANISYKNVHQSTNGNRTF